MRRRFGSEAADLLLHVQSSAIHTLVLIPLATLLLAFGNSARGGSKALISAISNPMTIALAAGLVWRRTGLAVPEPVDHVIGMLAAAAPALSLIALGFRQRGLSVFSAESIAAPPWAAPA
jgi:predicted permease